MSGTEERGPGETQPGKGRRGRHTQREPKDVHNHLNDNQLASPTRLTSLALPHGRGTGIDTVSDTRHDAADKHLREAESGGLQDGADGHDCGTNENGVLAAEALTDPYCGNCAEEAANVVDCGDGGLELVVADDAHCLEEIVCYDDAAEDALVIASELLDWRS